MLLVEGHRYRDEQLWQRTAWMVAHLLQPYTKERLTVDKLLGKESFSRPGTWTAVSEEEYKALLQRKQQTRSGEDVKLPDWLQHR